MCEPISHHARITHHPQWAVGALGRDGDVADGDGRGVVGGVVTNHHHRPSTPTHL